MRTPSGDEYAVILPCSQSDFADFISGLLGKPQTIERLFHGEYAIRKDDIESTYRLIEQRISQQDLANLIQFTLSTQYSDDSKVVHKSLADFLLYRELKPVRTVSVLMEWIYLIQFPDRKTPERQTIGVRFNAVDERDPDRRPRVVLSNSIEFYINHTARTWANDIETLLANHLSSLIQKDSGLKGFVRRHSFITALSVGMTIFAILIVGSYVVGKRIWNVQQAGIDAALQTAATDLQARVDLLLKLFSRNLWAKYYFGLVWYIIASILISVLFGIFTQAMAETGFESFVCTTERDATGLAKYQKRRSGEIRRLVVGFALGVLSGVVANIVYYFVSVRYIGS